MKQIIK